MAPPKSLLKLEVRDRNKIYVCAGVDKLDALVRVWNSESHQHLNVKLQSESSR
jgi:hypothetical protein